MSKQQFLSSSFKYREQDPSFVGEQLDQQYKKGPTQQRKCTDVFCCILFMAMIVGMCVVGYFGFKTGHPQLLASPFDQDGNQCGVKDGYKQYNKIYISFMNNDPTDIGFVCVRNCPQTQTSILQCKTSSQVPNCSALQMYASKTIVNLCYPSENIIQKFDFDSIMDVSVLQEYFSDLKDGWPLLCMAAGLALVVSILFTIFIRICAGCFVWFVIILFWLFMIAVGTGAFFINEWQFLQDFVHYQDLPDNLKNRDYQVACAIICWTFSLLQVIIVCCFMKQIRVSIGILKAAADFTRQQCYTFLIPFIITLLQLTFLALWLTSLLHIYSSSQQKIQPIQKTPFGFVQFNTNIQLYSILYVVGLFWVVFFIQALGNYWICSSVAIWYFQNGEPRAPLCRSIRRSIMQAGSLAFGALVIATVVLLRIMMQIFTKMLKKQTLGLQQQVAPAKFALKCASCCIACFQRLIRFLTNNAYIMMSISGKNFCESAKQSFYLVLRSTAQFAISHGTAKIFIIIGKLMIVALCCVAGYFALTSIQYYKTVIYSPVFMTILFGIVSYPIGSSFMSLFEMAANTILMCYSLELDLMKGTNPKCPPALRNFLREYVKDSSEYSHA